MLLKELIALVAEAKSSGGVSLGERGSFKVDDKPVSYMHWDRFGPKKFFFYALQGGDRERIEIPSNMDVMKDLPKWVEDQLVTAGKNIDKTGRSRFNESLNESVETQKSIAIKVAQWALQTEIENLKEQLKDLEDSTYDEDTENRTAIINTLTKASTLGQSASEWFYHLEFGELVEKQIKSQAKNFVLTKASFKK